MNDVLVVDDNLDTCDLLVHTLRLLGREALCATGGEEALNYLEQHSPCLVILDMNMPGVDGYHLLEVMRSNDRLREVPVIVFSGGGEKVLEDALRLGANDFLIKGCSSIQDIIDHVRACLQETN